MNSGEGTGPVYSHTIFALTNPSAKEALCVHNPSRYRRPILNQQLCGSNKSRQNSRGVQSTSWKCGESVRMGRQDEVELCCMDRWNVRILL